MSRIVFCVNSLSQESSLFGFLMKQKQFLSMLKIWKRKSWHVKSINRIRFWFCFFCYG